MLVIEDPTIAGIGCSVNEYLRYFSLLAASAGKRSAWSCKPCNALGVSQSRNSKLYLNMQNKAIHLFRF